MRLTYYNSKEYHMTTTVEVDYIYGNLDPLELNDEDRKELQSGKMKPMCNYAKDYAYHSVPWEFVISIED